MYKGPNTATARTVTGTACVNVCPSPEVVSTLVDICVTPRTFKKTEEMA